MTQRFKILSLCGGGSRGIFIASALSELERVTGRRIQEHFDLITGTSTGGLVALALAFGNRPDDILSLYKKHLPQIFPGRRWAFEPRKLAQALWHKYSNAALKDAVLAMVPADKTLFEASSRLCIPTVDVQKVIPTVLKTRHLSKYVRDPRLKAWEVGMATSAAPTYFPAFKCLDGRVFWDGGLWANDPTLVGVVEAVGELGHDIRSVDVLSIGTTKTVDDALLTAIRGGGLRLCNPLDPKLLMVVTTLSERSALEMGSLLIGQNRVVRIDDLVPGDGIKLDDVSSATLENLETRGRRAVSNILESDRNRFFHETAAPFVPVPWDALRL